MKSVHGVNNSVQTLNFTGRHYFARTGIPFSRPHDTEYPSAAAGC